MSHVVEFPSFHFCESISSNLLFWAQKQGKHMYFMPLSDTPQVCLTCMVTVCYSKLTQAVNFHFKLAPVKCFKMQFKTALLSAFGLDLQIYKRSIIFSNLCKKIWSTSSPRS